MLTDLLIPSIGLPLFFLLVAMVAGRFWAMAPALGAFVALVGSFYWVQGAPQWPPTAMDGVWLMALVASLAACLRPGWAAGLLLLGLPISVWVVWVFAGSLTLTMWLGQMLVLLVPALLTLIWLGRSLHAEQGFSFWSVAFLIAPAAILAPVIGLAGSLKLAALAGAVGMSMAVAWVLGYSPIAKASKEARLVWQALVPVLCLPLAWVALVSYHLVEVPPLALLPAILPWLAALVMHIGTKNRGLVTELAVLVVVTLPPLAFSLWYAWPEQSLY